MKAPMRHTPTPLAAVQKPRLPDDVAAKQVYYDVATRQLDAQIARIATIDSKVATTLAFSSTALAIFAAFAALAGTLKATASPLFLACVAAAVVVYLAQLFCLYRAYKPRKNFSYRPDLATLGAHAATFTDDEMRVWVADETARSLQTNEVILAAKVWDLERALGLLPVETLLLLAAAILPLLPS
jgi:hypothetical protein